MHMDPPSMGKGHLNKSTTVYEELATPFTLGKGSRGWSLWHRTASSRPAGQLRETPTQKNGRGYSSVGDHLPSMTDPEFYSQEGRKEKSKRERGKAM